MSIPVRHSGRIAFAALIVITLIAALLGGRMVALGWAPPGMSVGDRNVANPTFTIGPIEGLTTTWHWAPPATSIPLGTIAGFFQPAAPDATVIWTGAAEVERNDQGSTAICPLVEPGITIVQVQVIPADDGQAISSQSRFDVVDIDVQQITVSAIDAWVDPVQIDEDLSQDELNAQTMGYFFGTSIAALRDLGDDQYRTSVNRQVHMSVEVDPPGFAPLIEWRFDGQPIDAPPVPPIPGSGSVIDHGAGMGTSEQRWFPDIGNHVVDVGPPGNPAEVQIEIYSVTITSHTSGEDLVEEGEPIVFIGETDPPGYEDEITWLSSTKYGTGEPILGEGPIFITEFNDTWGYDPVIGPWQWLGVKADNVAFNQDQKMVFAYITNQGSDTVSVINMVTNMVVDTINVGAEPRWMALTDDFSTLYLVNHGSNNLYVISTRENKVTRVVDVGDGPCWVEIPETEQFVGVSNRDGGSFSIINVSTNEVSELQFDPDALTNWGKSKVSAELAQQLGRDVVITLNEGTDEAVVMGLPLNGDPPFVEAVIPTGPGSAPRWTDVLLRNDGSLSYISNGGNHTLSVVDFPLLAIVDTIEVGQGPYWVRHVPDATFGYVVNVIDNTLSKFSLSTNDVVATIPVGQNPGRLIITEDSAFVLVPNFDDNTVSVVSVRTDEVLETIPVGLNPNWIDISPDGTRAYVVNRGSNDVSVIDLDTFLVIRTIPVGINPNQVITRPHEHVFSGQ